MRAGEHPLKLGPPKQQALLAVLLLHANEVVSTDRLVDSLWGEAAPNTAATAVHGYVSGLRKALGDHGDRLATAPRGYTLRIEPGELDLDRFERVLDSGREQLAAAAPGRAAETLRAGLALWRGRPLAGFEDEPFAREAVARLEELRIQAREELITAELERGAAAELVAELRSLVSEHPFRERFRAQLMLALYRAGRQAEALATYDDARRAMVDELGLEPGPALRDLQRAILEHDPALAGPARRQAPGRPRRRRFALAAAGAAAVAAAAGAAALWLPARGDDEAGATARAGNALVLLDPRSGDVREAVAVGATPVAVALGEGAAWVVNADAQTLSRVDAETRETTTFATGGTPTDIAAGYGSVWVGDGEPLRSAQFAGLLTTAVARLDPRDANRARARPAAAAARGGLVLRRAPDRARCRRRVGDRAGLFGHARRSTDDACRRDAARGPSGRGGRRGRPGVGARRRSHGRADRPGAEPPHAPRAAARDLGVGARGGRGGGVGDRPGRRDPVADRAARRLDAGCNPGRNRRR